MKNYSKQREEIIKIIKESCKHLTAEEIYFLIKQKDPAVSRSTVYRNLGAFVKKGVVTQIAISNSPDKYEYIQDRKKHGHVVCEKCGKICDFNYNFDILQLKETIKRQTKIEIFDDGIVIKGICDSCKEAQN